MDLYYSEAAQHWKMIGRWLGVEDCEISHIGQTHKDDGEREMFYQMMFKWKGMKGKAATYRELISVLKRVKLQSVVESVEQKHMQYC